VAPPEALGFFVVGGEHLNKSRVGQKEKRAKQNGLGDSLYFLKNVKQERF
jgi:hypothetical protein